jgi:hypothetical protein
VSSPDPVAAYHDLLQDDRAAESHGILEDQLRRRELLFGGRRLCSVLRPRFFSAAQYKRLQDRAALVLSAFRTAHRAALERPDVLEQFRLTDWERALVGVDPGFPAASPVSRLDAFFVDADDLRFTEYNAETPAGAGFNDALTEAFFALPEMRDFARQWDLRPLPARHHVLHALLDAHARWSGRRGAPSPRIAIVDWSDVPTTIAFRLFQEKFARHGQNAVIVEPAACEYVGGRLRAAGAPVDIVYKRVLLTELVERGGSGIDHPILRAVRDGAVCMVNPPACKILHKKASLAVLHDERNAGLFSAEQRKAIASHIPWSRVVVERRTLYEGKEIDLIPFVAENRERLVLKPNDEYGGKGIVLGWEVDQAAWDAAIRVALSEPYIVQQRIPLPMEPYPSFVDGRLQLIDRMVDTAPFVAYGEHVDGCLTRLGTAGLLNVTAGGGSQTPTFVAEPR